MYVSKVAYICNQRHTGAMSESKPKQPCAVDVRVGQRVQERRIALGLSQQKLGTAMGITYQQIQKYEKGTNRIGCSRLFDFSAAMNVPVEYFFDGCGGKTAVATAAGIWPMPIAPNSRPKRWSVPELDARLGREAKSHEIEDPADIAVKKRLGIL